MPDNALETYLASLERHCDYRVIRALGSAETSTTELVSLDDELFTRKTIPRDQGLGGVIERIYFAQQQGRAIPRVPRIRECYATEDSIVVVSEYIAGKTLGDIIEEEGAGFAFALRYFPKICDTISALHEQFDPPIIHRDIKPGNIVISGGEPFVIDFGIARTQREDAESDTRHFGTRDYAPPEQYGFSQTDIRSDVYSLGRLLEFCLTGTLSDQTDSAKRQLLVPGTTIAASADLQHVISRATELDPAARFENVRALKDAFLNATQPIPRTTAAKVGRTALDLVILFVWTTAIYVLFGTANLMVNREPYYPMWFAVLSIMAFMVVPVVYVTVPLFDLKPLRSSTSARDREARKAWLKKWFLYGIAVVGSLLAVTIGIIAIAPPL